jgi:hypothetical protein
VLKFSKMSFSMVVFCFFHASSNNIDVVTMDFVFNNFFLKTTFRLLCQVKSIHFSFQYWLHYAIFLKKIDEFWLIQRNIKCCIYICVSIWHLIVISFFPHPTRSHNSNE